MRRLSHRCGITAAFLSIRRSAWLGAGSVWCRHRPACGWTAADWLGGWTCHVEQGHYGHDCRKADMALCGGVRAAVTDVGTEPRGERSADRIVRLRDFRQSDPRRRMTPAPFRDIAYPDGPERDDRGAYREAAHCAVAVWVPAWRCTAVRYADGEDGARSRRGQDRPVPLRALSVIGYPVGVRRSAAERRRPVGVTSTTPGPDGGRQGGLRRPGICTILHRRYGGLCYPQGRVGIGAVNAYRDIEGERCAAGHQAVLASDCRASTRAMVLQKSATAGWPHRARCSRPDRNPEPVDFGVALGCLSRAGAKLDRYRGDYWNRRNRYTWIGPPAEPVKRGEFKAFLARA